MTERELVVLEEQVKREILVSSWRENHLRWLGKNQKKVAEKFGATEEVNKINDIHIGYDKENYPHHILGGNTWLEFAQGFLVKNPRAKEQIEKFYKEDYQKYLRNTDNLESEYPVWVIGTHPGLNLGDVLPMVIG